MSLAQPTTGKRQVAWCLATVIWMSGIGGGFGLLAAYDLRSGPLDYAPAVWPASSRITPSHRGATLLFFAHPRCPCTRASLGELERLIARCQGRATAWIVFFLPSAADEAWEATDLWTTAAAIPAARVVRDFDGREARRFGAATSGQVLLYDAAGGLLFSGGITAARGHAGESPGRLAIEALLGGAVPTHRRTPVFGCPIVSPREAASDVAGQRHRRRSGSSHPHRVARVEKVALGRSQQCQ